MVTQGGDSHLIRRILAGDAVAERQLYDAHVDRVFRLAFRLTGDGAMAEDLTQDIFIRAFDRLQTFRGEGPLGAWLHRIATSVIYSALSKRRRVLEIEVPREDLEQMAEAGAGLNPDLRRRIDRAVADLDQPHRVVFVMHDLEGFTHQEIAAAMQTPVGTAKARLSRARRKLRGLLCESRPCLNAETSLGSE